MAWDALRFCRDYAVPYWLSGKNVRPGWVHVKCPCCSDHSNHGGFNPADGNYACWRCPGSHPVDVVRRLLGVPRDEAERIYAEYSGATGIRAGLNRKGPRDSAPVLPTKIHLPGGPLRPHHKRYLASRGFDPDKLENLYGLTGTGPVEEWQGSDFRLRVIIPIHDHRGRLVSFQGRDITGKQELRYKACPVAKAIMNYKDTLYGAHLAWGMSRVVVVEGVFDQWRMGDGFVCSFGTSMTDSQLAVLAQWPEIIFLFDPEPEAQSRALGYAKALASLGRQVELVEADFGLDANGDPRDAGDLSPEEAQELRMELMK